MKVIVVGLGIQGKKRQYHAGEDFSTSVDPVKSEAQYQYVTDVPLSSYDAALVCLPDEPKYEVLRYLLENGKHVLVEKPLWTETDEQLQELHALARRKNLVCYTAYNHRFEPHVIRMKALIESGVLGRIYSCQLFYGNGTARLVRNSEWRDQGAGVLPDLGSHLLDTVNFWFGQQPCEFTAMAMNCFENRAPDQVILFNKNSQPQLMFEMTLLSWRNHFVCNVLAEKGTAHIESLCKWGPSTFTYRQRQLPSGRPPEEAVTLVQDDPTWALEYAHFKQLIISGTVTNLSTDLWIQQELNRLAKEYVSLETA
jgi:predicted dehydrogenase